MGSVLGSDGEDEREAMTREGIEKKINALSAEIDRVISLDQAYTLSDGQGSTSVQRRTLKALRGELEYWESRLAQLTLGSGAVSVRVGGY